MPKQLFGTDGVRGVAGKYPLDPRTVFALGVALGHSVTRLATEPEVVIGMDTRESGPWIAEQVAGGLASCGVRTRFAGVTTTPGVAYLTRMNSFVAGVMISASHNPYHDNGIKVFSHSGYKIPDDQEHEMEREIFSLLESGVKPVPCPLAVDPGLDQHYINYLSGTLPESFDGLKLAIDCGNGAAYQLAPELFRRLGAETVCICSEPNGRNINLGCGALHLEALQKTVLAERADLGVAFDGDADRAIFVSREGRVVDGDGVMLLLAQYMRREGRLPGPDGQPAVISTVMSNLGLERALAADGIRMIRTPVGDKYVLEEMLRTGSALGGEQSGHVILTEYATTGDGLLTAIRVLEVVKKTGLGLGELTRDLKIYPQLLVNVRVASRKPLSELASVNREIDAVNKALGDAGRVLVRFSGTEPLARVMVEGPEAAQVEAYANRIAGAIRQELGG